MPGPGLVLSTLNGNCNPVRRNRNKLEPPLVSSSNRISLR
jgi:hypothetical protein